MNEAIIGQTIKDFRVLTATERESMGIDYGPAVALVLDNGTMIIPMRDEEWNGPGDFGMLDTDGRTFSVWPS